MNIQDLTARRDDLVTEARNLLDGDDVDQERYDQLVSEIEDANARLGRMRRITDLAGTERHLTPGDVTPPTATVDRSDDHLPPSLLPSADVLRGLHQTVLGRGALRTDAHHLDRAVVTSGDTGADDLAVQLSSNFRQPRRIVVAAGVQAQRVEGMTSTNYPVFGAGDAAIQTEGQAKQEYDAITDGQATPQMIAIWTDTTRQNLLTMTSFEAKLRNVLAAKVARREDELVIDTALATTGIQTLDMASVDPDALLEAAAMVAAGDVAAEPTLALVNPADIADVLGTTVGTGGSASPDFGSFLPRVAGMSVYPTSAIDPGEILVGAWGAASRFIVGIAPVYLVDSQSGIKTNTVTILMEEAVALAVDEPQGFVHLRPASGG